MTSLSIGSIPTAAIPSPDVRLNRSNFMLWRGLTLPNLPGTGLHVNLNSSTAVPPQTITKGAGDKEVTTVNPEYGRWWMQDEKVLGVVLGSMEPDIACQLIGCKTAAAAWIVVHAMFGA